MSAQLQFETPPDRPSQGAARWVLAGLLVCGLHAGAAAGGYLYWDRPPAGLPPPPAKIVAFELAPAPVAPPPPTAAPEPEPEPEIDLPPLAQLEALPPSPPKVKAEANATLTLPEKQKSPKKKATEAKKPEKKPEKKKAVEKQPTETLPPAKAAQQVSANARADLPRQPVAAAPVATGPTPDELAHISAATNQWELAFRKHIEKYRRYPKSAKRRHQEGTPLVAFVFDRAGNVLDARIARSSGFEALDAEAIATFQRASPLPPLPPEIAGQRLQRSIAIQFKLE